MRICAGAARVCPTDGRLRAHRPPYPTLHRGRLPGAPATPRTVPGAWWRPLPRVQAWTGHHGRPAYVLALCYEERHVTAFVLLPPVRVTAELLDELERRARLDGVPVEVLVQSLFLEALQVRDAMARVDPDAN